MVSYQANSQASIEEIYQQQNRITQSGMYVLGGWAVGNLVLNSGLLLGNPEGRTRHFYQMNIYWNLVNASLAGISLIQLNKTKNAELGMVDLLNRQKKLENILLLNVGLDVAYVVGGFYLRELGKDESRNQDLLTGFGNAVILQGSFLLIFDTMLYIIHARHAKKWMSVLSHLRFSHHGLGVRFRL